MWTIPSFQPDANRGRSCCISSVRPVCRARHHLPHLLKSRSYPHIGWTASLRALQQKLVVQNQRLTLLAERGERPNLASQVLGLAARELSALWGGPHSGLTQR